MASSLSRRRFVQLAGGTVAGATLTGAGPALLDPSMAVADTVVPTPLPPPASPSGAPAYEASVASAVHWWPAQRQVWTPIGWKGHLFRFNCFYNGTLVCDPGAVLAGPKPNVRPYQGKNFQLTVNMPSRSGSYAPFPTQEHDMWSDDLGLRKQGWVGDQETPVLWTEFRRQEGLVLRESVFAHVKGGKAVDTAIEPIYAWMRFEVAHVDERDSPDTFAFMLRLSKAFLKPTGIFDQEEGVPVRVRPGAAPLDGTLRMDRIWNPGGAPMKVPVHDASGDVRLIVSTPAKSSVSLHETDGTPGVYDLVLRMPVSLGNHLDVLVPMLPQPTAEANRELALGRDGALAECEAFWKPKAASVVKVSTPEPHVDEFFRRSPELAQVVAEKSPDTGKYTFLSGSYAYDVLWSTPTSMVSHMFLDLLGYHDVVEQHIEIYRDTQGSRVPPGPAFNGKKWPGYLSTPASLQAIDWLSDHGAILEILAVHALVTDRKQFIDRWADTIVAACDFIKQACALTNHDGVKGLIPPGVNSDEGIVTQGINSQAWAYKGLGSAVRLLRRVGHPRADEFKAFAATFRDTYVKAMRNLAVKSPTWTDKDGNKQPVLPSAFTGERGGFGDLTMFDSGALMSTWAGLMPATDPLMRSYLDFWREGPNTELFDAAHHNALDRVVLDHEQSSGEPCYSWNLFHSWQLNDRARYLEGMYGLLVGAISQDTFISCEHRNAIYGTLFTQPLITWTMRHAVIDDELVEDELHLLRMCPLAWISPESTTEFARVPTQLGPVDLSFRLSGDGRVLAVDFSGRWHHRPKRIALYPPPVPGLRVVRVNGRSYSAKKAITL